MAEDRGSVRKTVLVKRIGIAFIAIMMSACGQANGEDQSRENLDWKKVGSLTMPTGLADPERITLSQGRFERRAGAVVSTFQLGDKRVLGHLDSDGMIDAVGVLNVATRGRQEQTNQTMVVAFTNSGGQPQPAGTPLSLGANAILDDLSIADGLVTASYRTRTGTTVGPAAPHVVTARLGPNGLRPTTDIPNPATTSQLVFTNPSTTRVGGVLGHGERRRYAVKASSGQHWTISVVSPGHAAVLSIVGADGTPVIRPEQGQRGYVGGFPRPQPYVIELESVNGQPVEFALSVAVSGDSYYALPAFTYPASMPQPGSEKTLYLTYDDGPDPDWTTRILDVLARYRAKATFFVLGQAAKAYPEIMARIRREGHAVANHTYSHPSLAGMGPKRFQQEVGGTQRMLGKHASDCLRPPYGEIDGSTAAKARAIGLRLVLWDVDPSDWAKPGAGAIAGTVISGAHNGAVVLLHDGGGARHQTLEATETILRTLSRKGYTFASVCANR